MQMDGDSACIPKNWDAIPPIVNSGKVVAVGSSDPEFINLVTFTDLFSSTSVDFETSFSASTISSSVLTQH